MSDNQRPQNPTTKLPLTCFFWNNGRCTKSDEECRFHHEDTGVVARPPGTPADQELTCYYWSRGQCDLPAAACHYAHYDTGQVAPAPRRPSEVSARQQGLLQNQVAFGQSRQQLVGKVPTADVLVPRSRPVAGSQPPLPISGHEQGSLPHSFFLGLSALPARLPGLHASTDSHLSTEPSRYSQDEQPSFSYPHHAEPVERQSPVSNDQLTGSNRRPSTRYSHQDNASVQRGLLVDSGQAHGRTQERGAETLIPGIRRGDTPYRPSIGSTSIDIETDSKVAELAEQGEYHNREDVRRSVAAVRIQGIPRVSSSNGWGRLIDDYKERNRHRQP